MLIHKNMTMAGVIHSNYLLLTVLYRFNISLGFGDKTIEEVCNDRQINVDFFVEILNSYHDADYFPRQRLQIFPVEVLVDYIRSTHSDYLDNRLPDLESKIRSLSESCSEKNRKNLVLLEDFFGGYKTELISHIKREEDKVLPYILEIGVAYRERKSTSKLLNEIKTYSIDDYANEHEDVEDKLFDLKNIMIKYLPPVNNNFLCHSILIEIFRLEKDLNNHARIEDKVLVPKVRLMEKEILNLPVK